jgi:hypothetical protein
MSELIDVYWDNLHGQRVLVHRYAYVPPKDPTMEINDTEEDDEELDEDLPVKDLVQIFEEIQRYGKTKKEEQ